MLHCQTRDSRVLLLLCVGISASPPPVDIKKLLLLDRVVGVEKLDDLFNERLAGYFVFTIDELAAFSEITHERLGFNERGGLFPTLVCS